VYSSSRDSSPSARFAACSLKGKVRVAKPSSVGSDEWQLPGTVWYVKDRRHDAANKKENKHCSRKIFT
jgi:hypothetical protein